jgi:Domain of unknown function (DUF5069)
MSVTAPNLIKSPPRSGRETLGRYAWLARLADKVRAEQAGLEGEYIAYCGLSQGFLKSAGITEDDFDVLVRNGSSDADLVRYFDDHVDDAHREAANNYVLTDMKLYLDKQDAEEGR